MLPKIRHF